MKKLELKKIIRKEINNLLKESLITKNVNGINFNIIIMIENNNLIFQFIPSTIKEVEKIIDKNKFGKKLAGYITKKTKLKSKYMPNYGGAGMIVMVYSVDIMKYFENLIK